MFKNTGKKIFAVCLAFTLCVPCCFASAQTEKYLEELVRGEVARVLAENNLRCRFEGEVIEPSQMNMEQLLLAYNLLVDRKIARDLEDLDYFTKPPRLDVSLFNQDETIRKTICGEVERCLEKFGMMPQYKGCFVDLCQMNNEQLMWFYNWLLDQGKARAFGLLMRN